MTSRARRVRWPLLIVAVLVAPPSVTAVPQGDPDPTFGVSGTARIRVGDAGVGAVGGVDVLPDGRILIAVSAIASPDPLLALVRLVASGVPDGTFGDGGTIVGPDRVLLGLGGVVGDAGLVRAAATDTDANSDATYFFLRSFDGQGRPGRRIEARGVTAVEGLAMASDGARVLVFGLSGHGHPFTLPRDAVVAAFGTDGVDSTFADGGILSTQPITSGIAQDLGSGYVTLGMIGFAVGGGKVVLLAYFEADPGKTVPQPLRLLRYDANGRLDPGFGVGGIATVTTPGEARREILAPRLQADQKILTANAPAGDLSVMRIDTLGGVDHGFGSDGVARITVPGRFVDSADWIAVAPDGKIVVAASPFPQGGVFLLARLSRDGVPDPSFGGDGVVEASLAPFEATPRIVVQPNGDIVAFGRASDGPRHDLVVARYVGNPCGDGTPDPGEDCDAGSANGTEDSCCSALCRFQSAGTTCSRTNVCDGAGTCAAPRCGDQIVTGPEQCDDGDGSNASPASCCTASCTVKLPGTLCTGGACNASGRCVPPDASVCGNGVREGNEECDGEECCSQTCRIAGPATACGEQGRECKEADHCDGNAPVCQVGAFVPDGVPLCTDDDPCTVTDVCDGNGTCRPGERVCHVEFTGRTTAYHLLCQADTAGSCSVKLTVAGNPTGTVRAQRAGTCTAPPAPGSPADDLVRGSDAPKRLKKQRKGQFPFERSVVLKLSPKGRQLLRCGDLDLAADITVNRNGKAPISQTTLSALLKQIHAHR